MPIHPDFERLLRRVMITGRIFFVVGIGIIIYSLSPNIKFETSQGSGTYYDPSPGERIGAVLFGGLFSLVGVYTARTSTSWLRRASALVASTRPMPARLTVRIERTKIRERVSAFASLRPTDDSEEIFDPITAMPVFLGMVDHRSPLAEYTDAPALVYLPKTPDDPVVFSVDGVLWCSENWFKYKVKHGENQVYF